MQATVTDSATTLSKADINVYLDGEQVRDFQYRRTTGSLSFTPRKLSSGAHTVEIDGRRRRREQECQKELQLRRKLTGTGGEDTVRTRVVSRLAAHGFYSRGEESYAVLEVPASSETT